MLAGVLVCLLMIVPLALVVWHDDRRRRARARRPRLWMESAPYTAGDHAAVRVDGRDVLLRARRAS